MVVEDKQVVSEKVEVSNNQVNSMPVYFGVILAIVGLLLGAFVYSAFFVKSCPVQKECEECICDAVVKPVELILVYDSSCGVCDNNHTLLLSFDERNVVYDLKRVEASSVEGKKLISRFGIDSLPSVLVNAKEIKSYPAVSRALQASGFVETNGFFVVHEANFNPQDLRARELLDLSCSNSDKLKVILFDSPYGDLSIKLNENVDSVLRDFNNDIDFSYYYVNSNKIQDVNGENQLSEKYLHCADFQGKFLEYENAVKRIYCGYSDLNHLDMVPFNPDLAKCGTPANKHLHFALREGELVMAAVASDVNVSELEDCAVNFNPGLKPISLEDFKSLKLKRTIIGPSGERYWMPLFLVGCKYLVGVLDLKKAICELKPGLSQCSDLDSVENQDFNNFNEADTNQELDANV